MESKVTKTEAQWRAELPEPSFCVLRQGDTERPFTGRFWDHHEAGIYACRGCGTELFGSDSKFDSGPGWPSYFRPLAPDALALVRDRSHGMERVEVRCARCEGHLGHLFDDGPPPTRQRYCINSASLDFRPAGKP